MITVQSDKENTSYSVSLLDSTVFRTMPTRFASRAPNGKSLTVRQAKASSCYTLLYGQSGCFRVRVSGREFLLTPHTLLLIEPDLSFSITAEENKSAHFLAVEFEITPRDFTLKELKNGFVFLENASELKPFFDELQLLSHDRYAYGEALLLTIFEKVRTLGCKKDDVHFLYRYILKRIRLHFADAPTVALIAFGTHYSADHLSRILKKSYGLSLSSLIKRERLKILKSYLRFTSFTSEHIAAVLGFVSHDAMIGFFRYHTGITPKEYRQKLTEHKNS